MFKMSHAWCMIAVVLVVSVYTADGAPKAEAAPAPVAEPEPCCGRGGAFVSGAIVGGAISRHRHHGGCCHRCGCGRKRRGIPDVFKKDKVELYHKQVLAEDKNQCGLRLICELAKKDDVKLTGKERLVMLPYRGAGASDGTSFGLYDEAAWHGTEGRDCHLLYPLCSFQADHIMGKAIEDLSQEKYEFI